MGLLVRANPWINMAILIVFALPAERAWGSPSFDDKFMSLFEPLPVIRGRCIVGDTLTTGAPDPT
jgi:hypothetical protein